MGVLSVYCVTWGNSANMTNMASDQAEVLKQKAKEAIDVYASDLYDLNKSIWENPELGFKETYAHDQLTKILEGPQ